MAEKKAKPKTAAKAKPKASTKPKATTAKAKPKAAPRKSAARPRTAHSKSATINVAELLDHPLVADLLSVGALAAVAAIADHNVKTRTGEASAGSSKAVKAAGVAAASAIGKRLLTEVKAVRDAGKGAKD